jgi:hypothetical protein
LDLTIGGHHESLQIMRAAYDHKKASQWRSFNLGLSKMDESITLFMAIENALREVRDMFQVWEIQGCVEAPPTIQSSDGERPSTAFWATSMDFV